MCHWKLGHIDYPQAATWFNNTQILYWWNSGGQSETKFHFQHPSEMTISNRAAASSSSCKIDHVRINFSDFSGYRGKITARPASHVQKWGISTIGNSCLSEHHSNINTVKSCCIHHSFGISNSWGLAPPFFAFIAIFSSVVCWYSLE